MHFDEPGAPANRVTLDPVCGMQVEPDETTFSSRYDGDLIYFCREGCKRAFDRKPYLYDRGVSLD